MKDKIDKLLSLNHCGISIQINPHKEYYEGVESYFNSLMQNNIDSYAEELRKHEGDKVDEYIEIYKECCKRDCFIYIRIYPDTPVSFEDAFHYDFEKCLNLILQRDIYGRSK